MIMIGLVVIITRRCRLISCKYSQHSSFPPDRHIEEQRRERDRAELGLRVNNFRSTPTLISENSMTCGHYNLH